MSQASFIPLTGAKWAARSEAYASLISEHLAPSTVWLDAGCGSRLLEDDMDTLEKWLVGRCKLIFGMDPLSTWNRNIRSLLQGSLYKLPFADSSLDLITCHMVIEHLDRPRSAFAEVCRCLRPNGVFIAITPNMINYGIFANAVATKLIPEKWRLRIVHALDSRTDEDIFPVRYKANTMRGLRHLLRSAGLRIHRAIGLRQQQAYWRRHPSFERAFMWLTPIQVLLICAHKPASKTLSRLTQIPITKVQAPYSISSVPEAHLEHLLAPR